MTDPIRSGENVILAAKALYEAERHYEEAAIRGGLLLELGRCLDAHEAARAMAEPPCEHHWIGGNDGSWCTKCKIEMPAKAEPQPERGYMEMTAQPMVQDMLWQPSEKALAAARLALQRFRPDSDWAYDQDETNIAIALEDWAAENWTELRN